VLRLTLSMAKFFFCFFFNLRSCLFVVSSVLKSVVCSCYGEKLAKEVRFCIIFHLLGVSGLYAIVISVCFFF
jgi:hypothetical protein